jgi:hypothetical protein
VACPPEAVRIDIELEIGVGIGIRPGIAVAIRRCAETGLGSTIGIDSPLDAHGVSACNPIRQH